MPEYMIPAQFKYVTTRKNYNCEGCYKMIPKGSRVLHVRGRIGFWFSEYWCSLCELDRINGIPDSQLKKKILALRAQEHTR